MEAARLTAAMVEEDQRGTVAAAAPVWRTRLVRLASLLQFRPRRSVMGLATAWARGAGRPTTQYAVWGCRRKPRRR